MSGLTYDAGALIAAERNSSAIWALHRRALESHMRPTVSTTVLGQVWRGGRQARLSRLLRGCRIEPLTEAQARSAGEALGASAQHDLVDAVVVVSALARGDIVVTSDPQDLRRIASASGRGLTLHII
jgi:predicted nucleic acid-binding protein